MMLAGFVILVCALAALAYLVMRRMKVDEERDKHERRIMRDIPPPLGSAEFEHRSGVQTTHYPLRTWLDSWAGVGRVAVGMASPGLRPPAHALRCARLAR